MRGAVARGDKVGGARRTQQGLTLDKASLLLCTGLNLNRVASCPRTGYLPVPSSEANARPPPSASPAPTFAMPKKSLALLTYTSSTALRWSRGTAASARAYMSMAWRARPWLSSSLAYSRYSGLHS